MRMYPPSTIHIYLDLKIQTYNSHRHNTTPPLQTPVQATYPLPTYATHTTATKTQTHVLHFSCSDRIGKAQTQSSHPLTSLSTHAVPSQTHTHLTTPQTPQFPRTTLIHNTSAALDTMPEPRVPPTCPALTTSHPSPTPALPSTSHHHTQSADTHATQTTVHLSQSHQPPHPHSVPRQPHRHNMITDTTQGHRPSSKAENPKRRTWKTLNVAIKLINHLAMLKKTIICFFHRARKN